MKKNSIKLIALLLAAASVTGMAACGDAASTDTTASTDSVGTTESAGEELPITVKDFGGRDVHMYIWERSKFDVTEENGEVMNDALFTRNQTIQELYNVSFSYTSSPGDSSNFSTWYEVINSSILSGDDEFQLVAGYALRMAELSLEGNYHNLLETGIDFTKEWWPQDYIEKANLGGLLPMAAGNLDLDYYDRNYVIFFNKDMQTDLKLENPYELVNSGKWTLDKMAEQATAAAADLNGDAKVDENDRYGLIVGVNMPTDAFLFACDVPMSTMDANGLPVLTGLTERYIDLYGKLKTMFDSLEIHQAHEDDLEGLFMGGHAFMEASRLEYALTYRDMETDFGILPYPKFDEAQKEYHTFNSCGTSAGYLIPITADAELGACIIDAMAYFGYRDILPQYYEKALKGKGARDDESAAMLDIIRNGTYYDFTQIYGQSFDQKGPSYLLRTAFKNKQDISSLFASYEAMHQDVVQGLIDALK